MIKYIIFLVAIVIAVLAAYVLNFNNIFGLRSFFGLNDFSKDPAVWGTFGDYIGGVLNPILTFVSVIMLIRSISLQAEANKTIVDSEKKKDESEEIKRFEDSLYNLTSSGKEEYRHFKIILNGQWYQSLHGLSELESSVLANIRALKSSNLSHEEIYDHVSDYINTVDNESGQSIFALVRSTFVCVRFLKEKCPEGSIDYYSDLFSSMLPSRLTQILCLLSIFVNWANLDYIRNNGGTLLTHHSLERYRSSIVQFIES